MDSLTWQLNDRYRRFMERNPNAEVTISIMAHSLGTVISYDILSNQRAHLADPPPPTSADEATAALRRSILADRIRQKLAEQGSEARLLRAQLAAVEEGRPLPHAKSTIYQHQEVVFSKLDFKVTHLFNMGSPLGMFLHLRYVVIRVHASYAHLVAFSLSLSLSLSLSRARD